MPGTMGAGCARKRRHIARVPFEPRLAKARGATPARALTGAACLCRPSCCMLQCSSITSCARGLCCWLAAASKGCQSGVLRDVDFTAGL